MNVEKNITVGNVLQSVRIAQHLEQTDVAISLGRPQSFISKLEHGDRILYAYEIPEVASALGVDAMKLFSLINGALEEMQRKQH